MSVSGLRREDFPVLDRLTYLNTASVGLVPASVVTPAHEFELELAQARTTGMDEDAEMAVLEDTRRGGHSGGRQRHHAPAAELGNAAHPSNPWVPTAPPRRSWTHRGAVPSSGSGRNRGGSVSPSSCVSEGGLAH